VCMRGCVDLKAEVEEGLAHALTHFGRAKLLLQDTYAHTDTHAHTHTHILEETLPAVLCVYEHYVLARVKERKEGKKKKK
jgi:hypothetical protein